MDACVLRPPSNRVLSDSVIASVVQHKRGFGAFNASGERPSGFNNSREAHWPRYASEERAQTTTRQYSPDPFTGRLYGTLHDQTPAVNCPTAPVDRKRKLQESNSPTTSKLMLLAVSSSDATQAAKKAAQDALNAVATQDWFIAQQKHLREIRRMRQIRYRKQQQDNMEALDEGNRQLQQEIAKLEQRRRAISTAIPTEKTLWKVAVEYFRLFRFGLRASDLAERSPTSPVSKPSVQLDFLRSTMAPGVMYNAGRGVETILRSWRYISLWFQDFEIELENLEKAWRGRLSLLR